MYFGTLVVVVHLVLILHIISVRYSIGELSLLGLSNLLLLTNWSCVAIGGRLVLIIGQGLSEMAHVGNSRGGGGVKNSHKFS